MHATLSTFNLHIYRIILQFVSNILLVLVWNYVQMGAVEATFEEIPNIFDTGGAKGLPGDSVEKIPKIVITNDNNVDASGERVSCSVCLQVTESNSLILLYLCFFYLICMIITVAKKLISCVYTISKCRTFRWVKQLEVYLSAITCFTYLASIHGW